MENALENTASNSLIITETIKGYLRESAKWSFFLAIMGFIGIGFMLLAAIIMMVASSFAAADATGFGAFGGVLAAVYLLFAVIYAFPVYYLYRYAADMKTALNSDNNEVLTSAFESLKSHHKFLGITIISIMVIYILVIIGVVVFMGKTLFMH